jgi:hypothetical protein
MLKIISTTIIEKLESLGRRKIARQKQIKLPEQKPDTFSYVNKAKDYAEEMATMKFEMKKIEFYPEDLEKMKTMSHKEKMEYVKKLRQEKRYIDKSDNKSSTSD